MERECARPLHGKARESSQSLALEARHQSHCRCKRRTLKRLSLQRQGNNGGSAWGRWQWQGAHTPAAGVEAVQPPRVAIPPLGVHAPHLCGSSWGEGGCAVAASVPVPTPAPNGLIICTSRPLPALGSQAPTAAVQRSRWAPARLGWKLEPQGSRQRVNHKPKSTRTSHKARGCCSSLGPPAGCLGGTPCRH